MHFGYYPQSIFRYPAFVPQRRLVKPWKVVLFVVIVAITVLVVCNWLKKQPSTTRWHQIQQQTLSEALQSFQNGQVPVPDNSDVWEMVGSPERLSDTTTTTTRLRQSNFNPRSSRPQQHPPSFADTLPFVSTKYTRKRPTKKQRHRILTRQRYQCKMCRRKLFQFDTQIDHWVPLAADKFGQYSRQLNSESNLVALCTRCHAWKSDGERKSLIYQRK